MRDLSRLLRPRSIAVLGGGWAANVIEQCEKMGFEGEVWPVHPRGKEIAGRTAFAQLADLPAAPDATFVGVNRAATIDVVGELSGMGAGGAICFASGWSEVGAADMQADLLDAAGDMPILGPNCYGLLNYLDGAAIWPDQHGGERVPTGVAIISQSSNIAINLTMQKRGLPVAYVVCVGNAAQCGAASVAETLLADTRVTALGFYLEGIEDAGALAALAEAARTAGKGVVALKSGKTHAGVAAAASHTAALAGEATASSAFLRQAGIAEVATPAELLETLKIFHTYGPLGGRRISSCSCSGGEAGLVADLAEPCGLTFPHPSPANVARLSEVLGPMVPISNPLDYQTYIWGDLEKTTEVFAAMLDGVDAGVFVIDPPRGDRCDPSSFTPALEAIGLAAARSGRPALAVASLAEGFDEAQCADLSEAGVLAMGGLETALAAISAAGTEPGAAGWRPWPVLGSDQSETIYEAAAKALLAEAGIPVPEGRACTTLDEVRAAARDLTPPLALKGMGFVHKSEAGAVRLGLRDLDDETEIHGADGYLVEEMIQGGLAELILGVRRDPVYGATLTLGVGGVTAELLHDTQTLVLPVTEAEVDAALRRLRLWPLLDGYRGRARPALRPVLDAAMALQGLMAARAEIIEIEINPLILTATTAVAADALIRKATS